MYIESKSLRLAPHFAAYIEQIGLARSISTRQPPTRPYHLLRAQSQQSLTSTLTSQFSLLVNINMLTPPLKIKRNREYEDENNLQEGDARLRKVAKTPSLTPRLSPTAHARNDMHTNARSKAEQIRFRQS